MSRHDARSLSPWSPLLGALTLVAVLASPGLVAQKEADARVKPSSSAPAGKVLEWTSPQGKPFWYRVPKKKKPGGQKPNLILMLHGTGMKWGWAFWNYPIANGGFRGQDIVVAPEGMTPGHGDTFNFVQNKADGEQIADLIRLFRDGCDIDRVYLYGHSQGAFFCYWFAGEHPELVDGIVAHAGNVLSVKHGKLAKQKVAIGILHGKADAVVPVDCAYRTHRIYTNEGYANVKLYVVDGLTERSGHWPLPVQVGEMMDWLDQVTASSPQAAIDVALEELRAKAPDLQTVADAVERATALAKKAKKAELEAAGFATRVALVEDVLVAVEAAHVDALLAEPTWSDKKAAYGAWAAEVRVAHRAFAGGADYKKRARAVAAKAKAHGKAVAKALKALGNPSAKAFRVGAKAIERGFLASDYDTLASTMTGLLDSPPAGVKPDAVAAVRATLDARRGPDAAGAESAAKRTAEVVATFGERLDALRENGEEADGGADK